MTISVIDAKRDNYNEIREIRRMNSYRRRVKEIKRQRRKMCLFALTFAIVIIAGISFGSVHSYARQTRNVERTKCYKSVMIESGRTLDDLASENMSVEFKTRQAYIDEVKFINHLTDDIIHAGAYIIVPYYN